MTSTPPDASARYLSACASGRTSPKRMPYARRSPGSPSDEIRRQARGQSRRDSREVTQGAQSQSVGCLAADSDGIRVLEAEWRQPSHAEALVERALHFREDRMRVRLGRFAEDDEEAGA